MQHRALGSSEISVSVLSLGSWRSFERISAEQGVAVMRAAREVGIDFFDDARYNDETGTAPMPTGWSEVVFGERFRAAGWNRYDVAVANKLWWEFWPDESALQEIDGSLARMGFDHIDLIYAERPPPNLSLEELVSQIGSVLTAGKARAWGVLNWPAAQIAEVTRLADGHGVARPCAAQLAYNVVWRAPVEDVEMIGVLEEAHVAVVASAVLAFGALTGKYSRGSGGRIDDEVDSPRFAPAIAAAEKLRPIAERLATTPAALALAYVLANPHVATALFGATSPEQVRENAGAAELQLDDETLAELGTLG
jgi:aryl-alcohol dehydrogenase-like predicted oxidoreductase